MKYSFSIIQSLSLSLVLLFACTLTMQADDELKGMVTNKTATYDYTTQKGTITLESYVEGTMRKVKKDTPADVMFVLDVSWSMEETEMKKMKAYVKNFIDALYTNYENSTASPKPVHRVGIISFAATGILVSDYIELNSVDSVNLLKRKIGTEADEGFLYRMGSTCTDRAMHLADLIVTGGKKGKELRLNDNEYMTWNGTTSTDGNNHTYAYYDRDDPSTSFTFDRSANGGTWPNNDTYRKYMWSANNNYYGGARSTANSYVVLIGDGTCSEQDASHNNSTLTQAQLAAIGSAKNLKDRGATIYCVNYVDANESSDDRIAIAKFFNSISSNYPSTTSIVSDKVMKGFTSEVATSGTGLNEILSKISQDVIDGCAYVELTDITVTDIIDNTHFELPAGTTVSDIKVYKQNCSDATFNSTTKTFDCTFETTKTPLTKDTHYTISVSTTDNKVEIVPMVANYNPTTEWCGNIINALTGDATAHGSKMVVEIPFVVKGTNTAIGTFDTNKTGSGVTGKDGTNELGEPFPTPTLPIYDLVIEKSGLKKGESAIYYIYDTDNRGVVYSRVVLTGDGSSTVSKRMFYVDGGEYEVVETSWDWTNTTNTSISQTVRTTPKFEFGTTAKTGTLPNHGENVKKNEFAK